jgi:hypothetical protein
MYRIRLKSTLKLILISAIWQNPSGTLDQAKAQTPQEIIITQPQADLCDRHRILVEAGAIAHIELLQCQEAIKPQPPAIDKTNQQYICERLKILYKEGAIAANTLNSCQTPQNTASSLEQLRQQYLRFKLLRNEGAVAEIEMLNAEFLYLQALKQSLTTPSPPQSHKSSAK